MGVGAAELLGQAYKLRKLSLFASRLGDEGARLVADRLSAATFVQLMELELSGCSIGTEGMVCLFNVLESQAAPALEVCPSHIRCPPCSSYHLSWIKTIGQMQISSGFSFVWRFHDTLQSAANAGANTHAIHAVSYLMCVICYKSLILHII